MCAEAEFTGPIERGALNMKSMRNLLLVLLGIGVAGPAAAWGNDSEQPGSVLVFPKFIRGTIVDGYSGQVNHAVTEFELSVVCPANTSCSNNAVFLKANWVCPECREASFNLKTTIGGTLYFNPEGVVSVLGVLTANAFPSNATTIIPVPPCERGYLIVWAVDSAGRAIKQDGLIGDAVIREPTPTCNGPCSARGYNAIAIQAGNDVANTLDLTDLNGNGALDFNGSEYQMVDGNIVGTVRYENAGALGGVRTDLTLLTLDAITNRPNPTTSVGLNFFTPDEAFVDVGTSFVCWKEQRLTDINASLIEQNMGRKGLVESTYATQIDTFGATKPVTLLGIVETKESSVRDFAYSLSNRCDAVTTTYVPGSSPGF